MSRTLRILLVVPTLLLAACTGNDSSPVGLELLPGDVLGGLRVTVSTSFSRAVDFVVFPARRAQEDRLTSAHDWPTAQDFESRVAVRFDLGVLDSLLAGTTFSDPTLRLVFAEVDADVTFAIHRLTSPWNEEAATWERRDFGQPWATAGGDFDPVAVVRFTLTPLPADTAATDTTGARPDSIRVPIPPDLFADWRTGAIPNHGIVLIQETPGRVVDFVSRGDHGNNPRGPTLEVEADVPDTGFASLDLLAVEDVFLPIDRSPFASDGLVLRGADPPHRALLEPALDDIPPGSSIASVQLVLTLRAVDIPRDSMHLFAVQPVTEFRGENTIFAPLLAAVAGTVLHTTSQPGDTVVLEAPQLTRLVRSWLRDPERNLGVGLRLGEFGPTSEALFLGGVQFHGLEAPAELRPRLRIVLIPSLFGGGS